MNTKSETDIDVNASTETRREDCTDPVQSPSQVRPLSARLARLGVWVAARMKAHEDRMISLRVYRQDRLDGGVSGERKDA